MNSLTTALITVALLAALAPVLARLLARWVPIPVIVFELVLGIVAGPAVLGLVEPSEAMTLLSQFGVAMLFFMAGTEINGRALRGRTGRAAWLGWFVSLAAGIGLGWLVAPGMGAVVIGIAMSSTALGTLVPVLRDNGDFGTPFGTSIGAIGAVGEFGPIVVMSLVLSGRAPWLAIVLLAGFGIVAAFTVWRAHRFTRGRGQLHRFVESTLHTSGQFAVRLVLLVLSALVALSLALRVDMLLGAFTAGIIWRTLIRDASPETQEAVESKIEALAFGFLIPLFFITTGIKFDLQALLRQPWTLALVPAVTLALLIVRGIPASFAAPEGADRRDRLGIALMGATALPIIVVATGDGVAQGYLSSTAAAVLVGAGMLSVLVFPVIAGAVRAR